MKIQRKVYLHIILILVEIIEISSGWGLLPLFTADGGPIENKTYEIKLYGGTPFEKDVELGISPERKGIICIQI